MTTGRVTLIVVLAGLLLVGSLAWLHAGEWPELRDASGPVLIDEVEVVDLQTAMTPPPVIPELQVPTETAYFEAVLLQGGVASKKTAIRELRHIGTEDAVAALSIGLSDEDPRIRRAAVNSLGDIGDDYSITVIQEALQDADEEVRQRAIEVIDEINDDAAFRALYPPLPD